MDLTRKKDGAKVTEVVTEVLLLFIGIAVVGGVTWAAAQVMIIVGPREFIFWVVATGMVVLWTSLIAKLVKNA